MDRDKIRICLRIPRRPFRAVLSLLILAAMAHVFLSAGTTIRTRFPAPMAMYKSIITTGETVLARYGGQVLIGPAPPSGPAKLEVKGNVTVSGTLTAGGAGLSGPLDMTNKRAVRLAEPTDPQDIATKKYLQDEIAKRLTPVAAQKTCTWYKMNYLLQCGSIGPAPRCSPIDPTGQKCLEVQACTQGSGNSLPECAGPYYSNDPGYSNDPAAKCWAYRCWCGCVPPQF